MMGLFYYALAFLVVGLLCDLLGDRGDGIPMYCLMGFFLFFFLFFSLVKWIWD